MNLGAPLNTPLKEMTLFVTARGDRGYFNTTAGRGYGKNDIWEFELDPRIRPSPATFVRGIVTDSSTGKPVGRASVVFVRLSEPAADTVRGVRSNESTGRFLLARRLQPLRAGATVTLNNIFFAYDQATLLPESQVELARILRFLRENPRTRIELRGHTDAKGTPAYNLKLSQDRATAVRDFLVNNGILATRLVAKGYGETLPVAPNTSDDGRALNRRTELRVLGAK
jgi:outer membrane protein OmpA-like peptidoglycan-associated protein